MDFVAVDRLARTQHALVTTQQLLELGATHGWIRRQVAHGRLLRIRTGVFRTLGGPVSQDQAWLAAVLEARVDAVLSHETAGAAWGLKGFEPPPHIDLLTVANRPRRPGVGGHSTLWLPERDRTVLRRIPITTAARTLVDAAGRRHAWVLGRVVDDALRRNLVTLPRLVRCFESVPVSGRRPSRSMRDVLAERVPGFHPGGSASELDIMTILKRAGIHPLPEQQYRVEVEGHRYLLDYAWPDSKQAIEYQGDPHAAVSAIHDDLERLRRLQRAGWQLWPVTDHTSDNEVVAIGVGATESTVDAA